MCCCKMVEVAITRSVFVAADIFFGFSKLKICEEFKCATFKVSIESSCNNTFYDSKIERLAGP